MLHSALTRWLKQGLELGMCPLCRVSHKLDRQFMWQFFDERSHLLETHRRPAAA